MLRHGHDCHNLTTIACGSHFPFQTQIMIINEINNNDSIYICIYVNNLNSFKTTLVFFHYTYVIRLYMFLYYYTLQIPDYKSKNIDRNYKNA